MIGSHLMPHSVVALPHNPYTTTAITPLDPRYTCMLCISSKRQAEPVPVRRVTADPSYFRHCYHLQHDQCPSDLETILRLQMMQGNWQQLTCAT